MARRRKLEVLDLDSLRDLLRMRGWALIVDRIERMRAAKIEELIHPRPELESAKLRGEIAMCDVLTKIPSILITESTSTKPDRGD